MNFLIDYENQKEIILELWNKCSKKLENTLSQEDFNTWIRPLKASVEKNTLSLIAPNDFILDLSLIHI